MTAPRVLLGDATGELVRRKIVVFKRLEPGDLPSPGSQPLRESPYLEGRIVEIAIGKDVHDRMVHLAKLRTATVHDDVSLGSKYDVPGMLIAGSGGAMVGAVFDFLPIHILPYLGAIFGLGVVLAFVTRVRKRGGEIAAEERWKALPEHNEYEGLARDLASAWITFAGDIKAETGCHVELRVAEGSEDPLRLASVDPRGFIAMPPTFDPEDFLPTEGAGVRYEVVHALGEVVTRLLEGVKDSPMPGIAEATKAEAEDAAAEPDAEAEAEAEADETSEAEADAKSEPEADAKDEDAAKGEPAAKPEVASAAAEETAADVEPS